MSGRQQYVITYTVDGALNAFEDHDELYWNAVGAGWGVPIDRVGVVVRTPADITQQACFAGPVGSSLPCEALGLGVGPDGDVMTAGQPSGLQPYDAMTVVVGLPKGAVSATGPHLEERWSLSKAMTPTPVTGTLAGLILIPGLAGVVWLATNRGRDRRFAGQTPGLTPTSGAVEEPVPLTGAGPVAVQFQPPEGLRPGQLGTLIDEQANVLDVTATIVDLAVRGHLRIVELEREHWFSSRDWRLERLPGGTGDLLAYEKLLYDGLFETGEQVLLSSLKKTFAARMGKVQTALYEDVTRAGWFRGRPDKVRGVWQVAGIGLIIAGAVATSSSASCCTGRRSGSPSSCWASRCSSSPAGCRPARPRGQPCWRRRRGSASTSGRPRRSRCASRRGRTSSAATCPTPSCSARRIDG